MDKLTLQNKERFFALYWEQDVGMREYGRQTRFVDANFMRYPKDSYLFLKHISSITSEQAIEITRLLGESKKEIPDKYAIDFVRGFLSDENNIPAWVSDHLRERRFAVSWNGITVEEMVEAGWVKLIQKGESNE